MSESKKFVIISTLLQSGEMTLFELERKTNFSAHIIKSKISELNQLLKNVVTIKLKASHYKLVIENQVTFEHLFSGKFHALSNFNSSGKRQAYILKCLVDSDYILKGDLAEEMQVADTTITKDLKRLREMLKDFQLSISGTPNRGLKLNGHESRIRLVLIHHVMDYLPDDFRLNQAVQSAIDQYALSKNIEKKSHDLLEKSLAVSLYRLSQMHFIEEYPYYYNKFLMIPELENLFETVETDVGLTLSHYEREFIQFPVYVYFNQLTEIALDGHDTQTLETTFQKMMFEVEKQFLIKINRSAFFKKIRTHLITMLNRIIFHVRPSDIFIGEIATSFPVATKMAEIALVTLSNIMGTRAEQAELGYLAVHFELLLQEKNQNTYHHIAIVSNGSLAIQTMIKQRIADIVGSQSHITNLSELTAKQADLNAYDVIFSTVALESKNIDTVIVRISHLFDEERLTKVWLEFQYGNRILLEEETVYQNELDVMISYQENINQILDILLSDQLIDTNFISHVQKSYFIENGISFPHAINDKITDPVLYVATSKEGIVFDDNKIFVILLLAVPSSMTPRTEKMTLDIYDIVFDLMRDTDLRNNLLKLESLIEILDFLNKGGIIR